MATGIRRIFKALVMNPVTVDQVDYYDPGYLVVNDGRIERLTSDDPRPQMRGAEFHDLSGFAILPGFVDVHVHLPQLAILGIGSGSLLDWLSDYTFPEEARFADAGYARNISERFFSALIANGTTCASIYCSVHEQATDIAFEAASRKGLRAFIGKSMMDRNAPPSMLEDTKESLRASARLYDKWDGSNDGRLRYVFTPRFAGSSSMDLMRRTATMAEERKALIQSHLSENKAEVEWIRSLFPECSSYADVYGSAGLLGPGTIMAHCLHLSDEEISLLAKTRTRTAFCPHSNRVLRSGAMPYSKLKRAGIEIGLGTDIAGGATLSMFHQMGEALSTANADEQSLSPVGAFYLATLGGAKVLSIDDKIGNFAAGKDADFIVVDYRRVDPMEGNGPYNSPNHMLSRLCYSGDANCVRQVYVQGVLTHDVSVSG